MVFVFVLEDKQASLFVKRGEVFFFLLLFSFSPYIANYVHVHIITPSQCYRDVTPFKKTILQTVGY